MSSIQYWVNGDGDTDTWTLPSSPFALQVFWNGLFQPPDTYAVAGQQVTTLSFIPSATDLIAFLYDDSDSLGQVQTWVNGDGVTRTWILPSFPYVPIEVFYNGLLISPDSYTINGQQVTLSFVPSATDQIGFLYYPDQRGVPTSVVASWIVEMFAGAGSQRSISGAGIVTQGNGNGEAAPLTGSGVQESITGCGTVGRVTGSGIITPSIAGTWAVTLDENSPT